MVQGLRLGLIRVRCRSLWVLGVREGWPAHSVRKVPCPETLLYTVDVSPLTDSLWSIHADTSALYPTRHDEVTGITYSQTVAIFASGDLI